MTEAPGWEAPAATRRPRRWVWALAGLAAVALVARVAGAPHDDALPGLPVETVEQPHPRPDPVRTVPDPSDRWLSIGQAPLDLGRHAPGVWTGTELVVWNGEHTAAWTPGEGWAVRASAPERWVPVWSATWTGEEVLYFGGAGEHRLLRYSPEDDRWASPEPAPIDPRPASAVGWDATSLYVWGGASPGNGLPPYAVRHDLEADEWTALPDPPLRPRRDAVAQWLSDTGELVVWGGRAGGQQLADGAAYHPATGTWRTIPDAPWRYRLEPAVASDGLRRIFLWGLPSEGLHLPDGMVYDAVADTWEPLPDLLAQERAAASAVLLDDDLLVVWGGIDRRLRAGRLDGFVLDPGTTRWRQIPPAPIDERRGALLAWVDTSAAEGLLVWGGQWAGLVRGDGAFYPGALLRSAGGLTGDVHR